MRIPPRASQPYSAKHREKETFNNKHQEVNAKELCQDYTFITPCHANVFGLNIPLIYVVTEVITFYLSTIKAIATEIARATSSRETTTFSKKIG